MYSSFSPDWAGQETEFENQHVFASSTDTRTDFYSSSAWLGDAGNPGPSALNHAGHSSCPEDNRTSSSVYGIPYSTNVPYLPAGSSCGSDDHLLSDDLNNDQDRTSSPRAHTSILKPGRSTSVPSYWQPHENVVQHSWTQMGEITPSKDLGHHVLDVITGGIKTFFCRWPGCKHPVGFAQKPQLFTHIRSVHLQEKPFRCITCHATFARKQDATRHVITMNFGKQYECSVCHRAFTRKHYRDSHEGRCLVESTSRFNPQK
ncbi:hypothetical protein K439DRAFT_1633714 [Ramaria rubella]|nr:hypothetical protein K439DRAFT_1633714 [Ramaria rubella]